MAKTLRQQNFTFAGPTRAIPPILTARVANQKTGFASSCPLAEPGTSGEAASEARASPDIVPALRVSSNE